MNQITSFSRLVLIAALACLSVGCATATRGDKETVKFVSRPPGARVTFNGGEALTTPFSTVLKRKDTQHVVASLPGYRSLNFDLIAQRDLAAVPQLALPGGSALLATDVATGADRTYPSQITMEFVTQGPPLPPVLMKEFHGQILLPADYDKAVAAYKQALYNNRPVNQKQPNQPRQ